MESAWTAATTAVSSVTWPANAHLVAKEEVAAVGVAGVAEEAGEEDTALQVPTSKSIKMPPQPATGRLRAATTASSRRSREWSGASTEGLLYLPPTVHTRGLFGS